MRLRPAATSTERDYPPALAEWMPFRIGTAQYSQPWSQHRIFLTESWGGPGYVANFRLDPQGQYELTMVDKPGWEIWVGWRNSYAWVHNDFPSIPDGGRANYIAVGDRAIAWNWNTMVYTVDIDPRTLRMRVPSYFGHTDVGGSSPTEGGAGTQRLPDGSWRPFVTPWRRWTDSGSEFNGYNLRNIAVNPKTWEVFFWTGKHHYFVDPAPENDYIGTRWDDGRVYRGLLRPDGVMEPLELLGSGLPVVPAPYGQSESMDADIGYFLTSRVQLSATKFVYFAQTEMSTQWAPIPEGYYLIDLENPTATKRLRSNRNHVPGITSDQWGFEGTGVDGVSTPNYFHTVHQNRYLVRHQVTEEEVRVVKWFDLDKLDRGGATGGTWTRITLTDGKVVVGYSVPFFSLRAVYHDPFGSATPISGVESQASWSRAPHGGWITTPKPEPSQPPIMRATRPWFIDNLIATGTGPGPVVFVPVGSEVPTAREVR